MCARVINLPVGTHSIPSSNPLHAFGLYRSQSDNPLPQASGGGDFGPAPTTYNRVSLGEPFSVLMMGIPGEHCGQAFVKGQVTRHCMVLKWTMLKRRYCIYIVKIFLWVEIRVENTARKEQQSEEYQAWNNRNA